MRHGLPLLALLLLGGRLWAAPPPHQRAVLPNGLVVLAVEDGSSPVACFHLGVRTGWGGPGAPERGLGALLQEINGRRLEQRLAEPAWAALRDEVRGNGLLALNTETGYCEARGRVTHARLEATLRLVGAVMFGRQPVAAEELTAARNGLLQADEAAGKRVVEVTFYRFLQALLGRQSPYASPVWGDGNSLRRADAEGVTAYACAYAGPNNSSICVIGPQTTRDLVTAVRASLGSAEPASSTVTRQTVRALGVSKVSAGTMARWRGGSVMLGFSTPDYGSRGYLAAQLVYMVLSGPEGRLAKDKRVEEALGLNQVFGHQQRGEGPVSLLPPMAGPRPFLAAHVVAQPRMIEAARALLLGHFTVFAQTPPSEAELQQAKMRLVNAAALSDLTRLNHAKAYNCYELYGAKSEAAWRLQEDVLSIKGTEITALAKQWFAQHAIGVILPGSGQ